MIHEVEDAIGDGFRYCAGGTIELAITPRLSLGLDVQYESFVGLYQGMRFSLAAGYNVGFSPARRAVERTTPAYAEPTQLVAPQRDIELTDANLRDIFPVLYKYYEARPIGSVVIQNATENPIRSIDVRLDIEKYVDNPKISATIDLLPPGEEKEIDLLALFNEQVLT